MTGLFRRIAQQIVGPPPAKVHAVARLPYAPPPALTLDDEALPAAPDPRPEGSVSRLVPAERTAPPAAPAVGEGDLSRPKAEPLARAETLAESAPTATDDRSLAPLILPTPILAESEATEPWPLEPPAPANALLEPDPTPSPSAMAPPPALPTSTPAKEGETVTVRLPPLVMAPASASMQTRRDVSSEPERTGQAAPAARTQASRRTVAATDAAEVHVHIGRVEVTAIQEAAPPKRETRRQGRQPMSLEDYLAKRQSGAA